MNNVTDSILKNVLPLSDKNAAAYVQFSEEYDSLEYNELESIQLGELKMYAVDQTTSICDWTEIFELLESKLNVFRIICDKPKSHLKSVNEVRPIETVKRIGYESIPYLASHSEDWLARTASGLKPARLFSRVEDDEYHIYENRVVKTLIDIIIRFLRKTEKSVRDQRDQLRGIMNSSVQTGSFGFDAGFQKAVHELLNNDEISSRERAASLELAEKLQKKAYILLKKYGSLKKSKLYRFLIRSKNVTNPLNETNILMMDKHYSEIYKLWKRIHEVVRPKTVEEERNTELQKISDAYIHFCQTLTGYAAHVLNFDIMSNGKYIRKDNIMLEINSDSSGIIRVELKDISKRSMNISRDITVPVDSEENYGKFSFFSPVLTWENDVTEKEIEDFCSLLKKNKTDKDARRKYNELKMAINQVNNNHDKPVKVSFMILPSPVEITPDSEVIKDTVPGLNDAAFVVLALPLCSENEQKITDYALMENEKIIVMPMTLFDINSFRRIQNVLYRCILMLEKGTCLNCGGNTRYDNNQHICSNCNNLILTRTRCPDPECRKEYHYLSYDVSEDIIRRMKDITRDNFFQWDSMYQYRNIVNMRVDSEKIRTVCPCCGK